MRKFQTDDSQQINELHYNDDGQQMMAFFRNGSVYYYHGVTLTQFGDIISAESVGTAFHEFARNHSNYRKVR